MKRPISSRLYSLLAEIAAKHSFHLPEEGIEHLVKQDRESLIDALVQEFSETGLGSDDEPNQRGVEIEEIIDFVGAIADQTDASSD
ncbi:MULTISPECIES: hypothetical protein [Stenotrophomonas]|uniref:hypothetical protein n=1 Tax=Stenotrophomonas TaxID=40323 RepID=UPI000D3B74B7|nr:MULTISPECIES: hypothetical protein [Stenotrophomonas]PTS80963.1 hypothetical protein DBR20_00915 [Stenotrophomonas sp. HMWF023]CAH0181719.1 hypothetical protein SRABI122_01439 [Stenotrophomonas lactitubi]CAH0200093.1 hypothetical protein SRABI102_01749 [Stenotrophomonas lactitubi]CAH0208757.1 hypothetical protein SRABI81_02136 [Stenotrophomonas lactitubi]CAH0230614.1 hypothetical protein SRABI66_02681 [Stenotrophomonas lactitubi]